MSNWTDELKAQVIDEYLAAEPTADNSMEIVKELAEKHDQSPNGVRMILSAAGKYVKKTPSASSSSSSGTSSGDKAPRVSKEAAHQRLTDAISATGQSVDSEIVSKLTGKAAIYLAEVIEAANSAD